MPNHHEEDLTVEEHTKQWNAAKDYKSKREDEIHELVFGKRPPKKVYANLDSLEGVVELGQGVNEEAAYNDYLMKLEGLILELTNKQKDIELGLVDLEYTNVEDK